MTDAPVNHARVATVVMATIMVGVVLWWLRGILTPFALALFLMVIIDGLARVLAHRIPVFPARTALPVAMVITVLVFGLAAYVVAANASDFVAQLIAYAPKLNGLIAHIGSDLGMQLPPTLDDLVAELNLPEYLSRIAGALKDVASGAALVFVYLIFLFISRHGFEQKARLLFPSPEERLRAGRIFFRIRTGVERYIWVQTFTGAIIALASYALMMAVGLDNAVFWAFLVFIFSYIPILGGAVGIFLPPVFALVQFGTHWQALALLVGAELIHFTVGNFVAPRMQGETLNVDPIVVVLSLAFWGAIWGVPGMFLSTPLTVVAIVVLIQFPQTRWIAVLASRDGEPERYARQPGDPSEPPDDRPDADARSRRGKAARARSNVTQE